MVIINGLVFRSILYRFLSFSNFRNNLQICYTLSIQKYTALLLNFQALVLFDVYSLVQATRINNIFEAKRHSSELSDIYDIS